MLWELNKL